MQAGYLLNVQPHAPLVISLAFNFNGDEPLPYLENRFKRLRQLTGTPFSQLFLQDKQSRWYTHGADGLGDNLTQTVEHIRHIINDINPTHVTTIGESMGGYGSILLGSLLGVDSIIAATPISFFDANLASQYGDKRYFNLMKQYASSAPSYATDLEKLVKKDPFYKQLTILYGTRPSQPHVEATSLDAMHAWRIKCFYPNAHLKVYPKADHLVPKYLIEQKHFNDLLIDLIAGLNPLLP